MTGAAVTLVTCNCDLHHRGKVVKTQALGADPAAVAVVAADLGEIAEIDWMLEVDLLQGRSGHATFLLLGEGVASVAILADHFAILAYVLPIMAAETSAGVEMAEVVGMGLPVQLHFREGGAAKNG